VAPAPAADLPERFFSAPWWRLLLWIVIFLAVRRGRRGRPLGVACNHGYPDAGGTVVTAARAAAGEWVLLSYRMPREPSTPRIAVWRKLKRLGIAQLGDGLVALPAGPRTREQLEWVAEEVTDGGGSAAIWLATPATRTQEDQLAQAMAAARAAEYRAVIAAAAEAAGDDAPAARASAVRRLRGELRAIQRRDYFPPAERDQAQAAVQALAAPGSDDAQAARPARGSGPGRAPGRSARQPQQEPA
jgi:hypothetical protein